MWLRQQPHRQNACFQEDSFYFNRLIDPRKRNTKRLNVFNDCMFLNWHTLDIFHRLFCFKKQRFGRWLCLRHSFIFLSDGSWTLQHFSSKLVFGLISVPLIFAKVVSFFWIHVINFTVLLGSGFSFCLPHLIFKIYSLYKLTMTAVDTQYNSVKNATTPITPSSQDMFRPQTAIFRCLSYAKTIPLSTYSHHM
jgi:hypothetical protein